MLKIFAYLSILMLVLAACIEEQEPVTYRILSPTPRPDVDSSQVPTMVAGGATVLPTDMPEPTLEPTVEVTEEATEEATAEATEETTEDGTAEATESLTGDASPEATEAVTDTAATVGTTPTATPESGEILPTPTSNNSALRQQQEDPNISITMRIDGTCFVSDVEIPVTVTVQSFNERPFYLYTRGNIMFSINNSPLGPDFPAPEPNLRDEFVRLEIEQTHVWDLEDLGLFLRGMGADAGIDFGVTTFGLPPGEYWVTAAYKNDKDGLTEQRDGTYLIPEAAWRGTVVSREVRFTVVSAAAECNPE